MLARPPARVGDEHRPHRHAGALREVAQLARQLLVRERLEAVEEPLEEQRREQAEQQRERGRPESGGEPATRPARCAPSQTSAVRREPGQHRADSDSPLPRRQSQRPDDWVEKPQRRSQAQPRQAESGSRTSAATTSTSAVELERPRPPGPAGRLPEPVARRRRRRSATSTASCSAQSTHERQVERPVVRPRPLDLFGGKRIRSVHVEVGELSDIYTASMSAGTGRRAALHGGRPASCAQPVARAAAAPQRPSRSSPARPLFVWLHKMQGLVRSAGRSWRTILAVAAFRGLLDLIFRRFIPWPSLFGIDNAELREEDVVTRRRVWFWRFWAKVACVRPADHLRHLRRARAQVRRRRREHRRHGRRPLALAITSTHVQRAELRSCRSSPSSSSSSSTS